MLHIDGHLGLNLLRRMATTKESAYGVATLGKSDVLLAKIASLNFTQ